MTVEKPNSVLPELRFPEFRSAGDWHFKPLKSVAVQVSDRVGEAVCVPMSVTAGAGLLSQEEKFGRTIAGQSYKNYIRLRKDDFAYNKSSTKDFPQGYIARYMGTEDAGVPNSIFTCFRTDAAAVVPAYLDHLFHGNYHGRWLRKYITVGARAHGALSVSDDDLMSMEVPFPPDTVSRREQTKIADCLDSLNDLTAAEVHKLQALQDQKKGLMRALMPNDGEAVPRLRFQEFSDAGDWREILLGQIVDLASGQVDPTQLPFCDLPHVGGENIESHTGKIQNVSTARRLKLTSGKYAFDESHVLYSKIRPALNKVAAPQFKGICSADIYPIRPKNHNLCREYLVYMLLSETFLTYATKHSARSKIPKINRDTLFAYPVMIPSPGEQRRIAACLSSLDEVLTAQTRKIAILKERKQGLLQRLFPKLEGVLE